MKKTHVASALLGLAVAFLLGSLAQHPVAAQAPQPPAPAQSPRFQISAFAVPQPGGAAFHGCYRVDKAAGEVWVIIPDQPPKKVAEPLRK